MAETSRRPGYAKAAVWATTMILVTANSIRDNIITNSKGIEWEYLPKGAAIGTGNDTQFRNNTLYSSREEAATAEGWPSSDRTLKTYLEHIGHSVTSSDGFLEFFMEARQQRKGYWREAYTARNVVNYFREGFGWDALGEKRLILFPIVSERNGKRTVSFPFINRSGFSISR